MRLIVALILVCIIAISSVLVVSKLAGRARIADMTEDNLYSLSKGTENILSSMNKPITLKLYYSRRAAIEGPEGIRFWNSYFRYVKDIISEYQKLSAGKIQFEIIDPQIYSDEEEEAVAYGLERKTLGKDSFFFGLVAVTDLGKVGIVPFFNSMRQEFVEYDLTKLINDITRRQKYSVGVISSMEVLGDDLDPYMAQILAMQGKRIKKPWAVIQDIKESFEVKRAAVDQGKILNEPDYLLLIHPKDLDQETLFAIDQYLLNGGRVVAFIDPYCIAESVTPQGSKLEPGERVSDLNKLTKKWGVTMERLQIVADPFFGAKVPIIQGKPPEVFPPFINLVAGTSEQCFNEKLPVSAGMQNAQMVLAGSLEVEGIDGVIVESLISSSSESNFWYPTALEFTTPPTYPQMAKSFKSENTGQKNLALLLRGEFATNFPAGIEIEVEETSTVGDKKDKFKGKKRITGLVKSQNEPMLVLVSDVDMLSQQFAYQSTNLGLTRINDNVPFLLNMLDYLGGNSDLISIRTRGRYLRPFIVFDEIERRAEAKTLKKQEELDMQIKAFQTELNELMLEANNDRMVLNKEIMAKKNALESKIRAVTRELRLLRKEKDNEVRALESRLQLLNILLAPSLVLLVAVAVFLRRRIMLRRKIQG